MQYDGDERVEEGLEKMGCSLCFQKEKKRKRKKEEDEVELKKFGFKWGAI